MCANYLILILFQSLPEDPRIKTRLEEDGFTHVIRIENPVAKDQGKYSCDIDKISTSGFLEADGKFQFQFFQIITDSGSKFAN